VWPHGLKLHFHLAEASKARTENNGGWWSAVTVNFLVRAMNGVGAGSAGFEVCGQFFG
jgi:hypothetical protein